MTTRQPIETAADSRYLTVFSDGIAKSDITLKNSQTGLLPKSSKMYEVGIDDLSLSLNGLSMLERSLSEPVVFEVLRLHYDVTIQVGAPGTWALFPTDFRLNNPRDYQFRNDLETFTTYSQILHRLADIGDKISEFINAGFIAGAAGDYEFPNCAAFVDPAQPAPQHLAFKLHSSGRLQIYGSRTFWSYFCLHIPSKRYQRSFLGYQYSRYRDQRVISMNPSDGSYIRERVTFDVTQPTRGFVQSWGLVDAQLDPNQTANWAGTGQTFGLVISTMLGANNAAQQILRTLQFTVLLAGNLFSSIDRRICIEVGTSLPITHSALIEDNEENSDFILGRFMIDPALRASDADTFDFHAQKFVLMDSTRRVLYHRLSPQSKVSTIRIQIYVRVRTFDEDADKWSMRTELLPMDQTDWWHCRLHFRELHKIGLREK
jgi:hypothetical protein